jgi:hypothetical protein
MSDDHTDDHATSRDRFEAIILSLIGGPVSSEAAGAREPEGDGCVRCGAARQPDGDLCSACRVYLLGDSDLDPAVDQGPAGWLFDGRALAELLESGELRLLMEDGSVLSGSQAVARATDAGQKPPARR